MGVAAALNFFANLPRPRLPVAVPAGRRQPGRRTCSLNDVHEGLAVMAASVATWTFGAGWPGLPIAAVLPCLFLRSAWRGARDAWTELPRPATTG